MHFSRRPISLALALAVGALVACQADETPGAPAAPPAPPPAPADTPPATAPAAATAVPVSTMVDTAATEPPTSTTVNTTEDAADLAARHDALAEASEKGTIPLNEVLGELGIKREDLAAPQPDTSPAPGAAPDADTAPETPTRTTFGIGDQFKLIAKTVDLAEGWSKTTRGIEFENAGVLLQVETVYFFQHEYLRIPVSMPSVTLCWVPNMRLVEHQENGEVVGRTLLPISRPS